MLCFPLRFARSSQCRLGSRQGRSDRTRWSAVAVNGGRILCTAAINSDGTIATTLAGSFIDPAKYPCSWHRLPSRFQRAVRQRPIQNGWFRIVQPDTLTFGTLPARSCTVADRFDFTTRSGYSASITTVTLSTPRSPCPSRGKPAPSSSTAAVTKQSGAATWSPSGEPPWAPTMGMAQSDTGGPVGL